MKETCPNCKSERYESINLHVSDVEYAFLHGDKFGKIDLKVCRDCGIVYLKREQFEKINKKRPEEIVGSQEYYYHKYNIKEESAEWHKEFGNITRTETLKLPTWEEFIQNKKFVDGNEIYFYDDIGMKYKLFKTQSLNPNMIYLLEEGIQGDYVNEKYELTKENYTLACRKCKELFLGEKNE